MHHDSREEKQRGKDSQAPNYIYAPLWIRGRELTGQRENDQQRNQEPAIVKPYLNSEDLEKFDLRFHFAHDPSFVKARVVLSAA